MGSKKNQEIEAMVLELNDCVKKSDAVVCLEGDGYERLPETKKIFDKGLADFIVISGNYNNPPFSIPAEEMAKVFVEKGVPLTKIILEERSQNTREQALEVMKLAKDRKWKKIILVASHFHQYRAYLSFLKAMDDLGMELRIFNAPARSLSWFEKTFVGQSRLELLGEELEKIRDYSQKGDLAGAGRVIEYQYWKEN